MTVYTSRILFFLSPTVLIYVHVLFTRDQQHLDSKSTPSYTSIIFTTEQANIPTMYDICYI